MGWLSGIDFLAQEVRDRYLERHGVDPLSPGYEPIFTCHLVVALVKDGCPEDCAFELTQEWLKDWIIRGKPGPSTEGAPSVQALEDL